MFAEVLGDSTDRPDNVLIFSVELGSRNCVRSNVNVWIAPPGIGSDIVERDSS